MFISKKVGASYAYFRATIIISTENSHPSIILTALYIFLTLQLATNHFYQHILKFFHDQGTSENQLPWNKCLTVAAPF